MRENPATVFSATDRALVQILARLIVEPGSEAQETKR